MNVTHHFISGHGAVLNTNGEVELDSIIMDGRTLAAGAVSSVKNIANPVSLARTVMEKVIFLFVQSFLISSFLSQLNNACWLRLLEEKERWVQY